MKLFHAADIHLGRSRLEGRLPDEDLAVAFRHIAEAAVRESADVLLLAGDLFDCPQVEPRHLRQAQEILQVLYDARIPVVAIEGNHDKAWVHSDAGTWVGFLCEDGLLRLLRPRFGPEGAILTPWDETERRGAFWDYGGIRFVGAGYLGAATPAKLRQIATALEPLQTHVVLLHAGPDYFVGEGGGYTRDDLAVLRAKVVYLALGHIHKPALFGGWACNPGSPENCDLREALYSSPPEGGAIPRGYAVVEIDPADRTQVRSLEIRSNPRRPVHQVELDCTPFGNKLKDGAAALVQAAVKGAAAKGCQPNAVLDLRLKGRLNLKRIALDPAQLAEEVKRLTGVCAVALDASQINLDEPSGGESVLASEAWPREELERHALRNLLAQCSLPNLSNEEESLAALFFELKEAIRSGRSTPNLAEMLSVSVLVDKWQAAHAAAPPGATAFQAIPSQSQEVTL